MNRTWSFYDARSGQFHPRRFSAPNDRDLAGRAPAGHEPIEGAFDRFTQRFDIDKRVVVDWTNEKAIEERDSRERVNGIKQRMAELDGKQVRSMTELLVDPNDAAARMHFDERRAELAQLRAQLTAETDTSARRG